MVVGLLLTAAAPSAALAQVTGDADPTVHVVQRNESLSLIAAMHHVRVADLASRNHLHEPYALRHNQRLRLPSNATTTTAAAPATRGHGESMTAVRPALLPSRPAPAPVRPAPVVRRIVDPPRGSRACGRWGCPRRPGVVNLARLATGQHTTANLRRPGRGVLGVMRSFLRSTDGRTHNIDPRLLRQLALFSDHFGGRTLEVISGFRPVRRGQHTAHSNHNIGHAVDFRVRGVSNHIVRDFCRTIPNTGCGFYPRSVFIHMDVRSSSAYWVDWSRPGQRPIYGREGHPPPEPSRAGSAPARDTTADALPPAGADPELDDVIADAPTVRDATPDPDDEHDTAPAPNSDPAGAPSP